MWYLIWSTLHKKDNLSGSHFVNSLPSTLMSFADIPRSDKIIGLIWIHSLGRSKEIFVKDDFGKNQEMTKKHAKLQKTDSL